MPAIRPEFLAQLPMVAALLATTQETFDAEQAVSEACEILEHCSLAFEDLLA